MNALCKKQKNPITFHFNWRVMDKYSIGIAVCLMLHYGIVEAHPYDVHLPSAEEERMLELYQEQREAAKNWERFKDLTNSEEERREALKDLYDSGEIS